MEPPITHEQAASYLDVIRDMIQHENVLVNQRLSWMFTLGGLLFAATSFLWKASPLEKGDVVSQISLLPLCDRPFLTSPKI